MPSEYEREIEEILRRLGDVDPPKRSRAQRLSDGLSRRWRGLTGWMGSLPSMLAPDQLMITAILFVVAGFLIRSIFPGGGAWLSFIGVVLFLAAFFLSFRGLWGGRRRETRWRGQVINLHEGQPTLGDRLVIWFRRNFGSR